MNSGITKVAETDEYYFFEGSSGSTYNCRKGCYGVSGYGSNVLSNLIKKGAETGTLIAVLEENVNVMELEYA
jgi:hypothetical protein